MVHAMDALRNPKDFVWSKIANTRVLPYRATSNATPIIAKIRFVFFIKTSSFLYDITIIAKKKEKMQKILKKCEK